MTHRAIVIVGGLLVLIGLTTWLVWPGATPISPAPTPAAARAVPVHAHERKADKEPMPNVASNSVPDSSCTIRGDIRRGSGEAISGAFVWAELAENTETSRRGQLLVERSSYRSLGDQVGTDAGGAFTLPTLSLARPVVVRYYVPGETYGGAGPFDVQHPPPAWLSVVVSNGGRLYGVLKSSDGVPVTNADVQLTCHTTASNGSPATSSRILHVDIEEDGTYLSHVLPAGSYSVAFNAPGYQRADTRERLTVREDELTPCDMIFEFDERQQPHLYGGTVLDWNTKLPVPNVTVTYKQDACVTTDISGRFVFQDIGNYARFSHADYVPISLSVPEGTNATVYLSAAAVVEVFVWTCDGKPFTNIGVQLHGPIGGLWRFGQTLQNMVNAFSTGNYVMLENVPVHFAPMCARVYSYRGPNSRFVAFSDAFTPTPGMRTRVDVHLPPFATLTVAFSASIDPADPHVRLYNTHDPGGKDNLFRHDYDFTKSSNAWSCSEIPAGSYRLEVVAPGLQLITNIAVAAPSTEVLVNLPGQGVIAGRVRDASGKPVSAGANALTGDYAAVDDLHRLVSVRYSSSDEPGAFAIKGLDPALRYFVEITSHNFTNILLHDVAPNGPLIDIRLPRMARVTGMVKDADGKALKAQVSVDGDQRAACHGEFLVSPVYPGPHILYVAADGYAPLRLPIEVGDTNLDVGGVVPRERGISLRGRIVKMNGDAAADWRVSCFELSPAEETVQYYDHVSSQADGTFVLTHVPPAIRLEIRIAGPSNEYNSVQARNITADKDFGDIPCWPRK